MTRRRITALAALAASMLLGGCALHGAGQRHEHGAAVEHKDGMHAADDKAMGGMCEMHRQMTAGKSPAEQQAAVEAHIRSMHGTVSDAMVAHHRETMARCPGGAAAAAK